MTHTVWHTQAVRYGVSGRWLPCSWRFLELEIQAASRQKRDTSSWHLQLRASVAELYDWWALRLEVCACLCVCTCVCVS